MNSTCQYKLLSPATSGESQDLLEGKNQEAGLRRLHALLAEWLRMENVVVLTAAGCSKSAGGPLMSDLEKLVLEAVEKCDLSAEAKSIIEWKKNNGYKDGNFESWLSYLFNASGLISEKNSPINSISWKGRKKTEDLEIKFNVEDEEKLRTYIQRAIYGECALELNLDELTDDVENSSGHIPFLSKLIARDTSLGRTHLFTLNYDTLFEQAMEELGVQYFDGFSGKASSRFDPAVYGLDIYYPGDVAEGRVRRFDKFLQYYKLHGSLHWYVDSRGIYRAQHKDMSFATKYRELVDDTEEKAKLLEGSAFENVQDFGILPTSQKFSQTLDMPYSHLFRLFQARLNQPQTFLLVLGYGFGDEHVTRIIETALTNPSLVMLVVEPNAGENSEIYKRITRYQELGQRAFVLTERLQDGEKPTYTIATFPDFAVNVMPDVQWLDDFKRLRKFEEQLKKTDDPDVHKSLDGEG